MNNATLKILGMRSPLFEFSFAFQIVKYPNLLVTMDSVYQTTLSVERVANMQQWV